MTALLLAFVALALLCLGVGLNHVQARLGLLETMLNEGLPPGHGVASTTNDANPAMRTELLSTGVHLFASRRCHACRRLMQNLGNDTLRVDAQLHIHYIDVPQSSAVDLASSLGAQLHTNAQELAAQVGADPLPYTIAVGAHDLVAGAVTPTVAQVARTARDGGIGAQLTTLASAEDASLATAAPRRTKGTAT